MHRIVLLLVSLGIGIFAAGAPAFSKPSDDAARKAKTEAKRAKGKNGGISEEDMTTARDYLNNIKKGSIAFVKPELRPALLVVAREALAAQGFSEENMLSPVELAYYTYVADTYSVTLRLLAGADASAPLPWSEDGHYWYNSRIAGFPTVALLPDMIQPDIRVLLPYYSFGNVDLSMKLKNGQTLREYLENHPEKYWAAQVLKNLDVNKDSQQPSDKNEPKAKKHGKKKGSVAGHAGGKKHKKKHAADEENSALDVPGFAASPDALCHPSKAMRQEAYDSVTVGDGNIYDGKKMYVNAILNNARVVDQCLLAGVNPNMVADSQVYSGLTPLLASLLSAGGNRHIATIILILHGGDVNQIATPYMDGVGKKTTPLHRMCDGGKEFALRHLLLILNPRHAPDFTVKDENGETPIQRARNAGAGKNEEVFKILREAGIDTEEKTGEKDAAE